MSKTTKAAILVAVGQINGGTSDKKGVLVPFAVQDGEELTEAKLAKLGVDAEALEDMIARGQAREMNVRAAESVDAGDGEALAAMTARAETAEAKVAELEKQLEEATAPLAPAPGAAG